MTRKSPSLDAAYGLKTPEDSKRLYADWAETYDRDFAAGMKYELPFRAADAFAAAGGQGPVLDVGAGTGLVAQRLSEHEIGPIDATDISPEMLKVARRKGLYRSLFVADITRPLDIGDDAYTGIISSGTFTLGHVGPHAFDELLRIAAPGALFVITISDAHFQAAGFAAKLQALTGQISNLSLPSVRIYSEAAQGEHADDTGKIAIFRKV